MAGGAGSFGDFVTANTTAATMTTEATAITTTGQRAVPETVPVPVPVPVPVLLSISISISIPSPDNAASISPAVPNLLPGSFSVALAITFPKRPFRTAGGIGAGSSDTCATHTAIADVPANT